jgi:hypothetical protein
MKEITLGLIGDHFDQIGEKLTFWVELDDLLLNDVLNGNAGGDGLTSLFKCGDAIERGYALRVCRAPL